MKLDWQCSRHNEAGDFPNACSQCLYEIKTNKTGPPLWVANSSGVQQTTQVTPGVKLPMTLPTDSSARKEYPIYRGVMRYFPAALAGMARISKAGNDKHNPGQALHHDRAKSMDHGDCIIRHMMDVADLQAALERGSTAVTKQDVLNEVSQLAWRALALSQELHEKFGSPLAPGAKE